MPGWSPILWAKQATNERSLAATREDLTNCFWDVNPPGSKTPGKILTIPGLKFWEDYGIGPIRGHIFAHNKIYIVSGNELYVVNSDKTSAMVGAIPGTGRVHMIANETHAGIATELGFYWATPFAVGNVDGVHYIAATYLNGYGILQERGTDRWFLTGLDDMTTINALDYTNSDAKPDRGLWLNSLGGEVVVFGGQSIERYYMSGDSYFPFTKAGQTIETGYLCGGAKMQDVLGWIADDYSARLIVQGQTRIVSSAGVEKWIRDRVNPSACEAMSYRQEGHEHWNLSWNDGSITYDLTTGLWHKRKSFNENRWRVENYSKAWGLDLVGDFENANIYELDPNTYYEENGSGTAEQIKMSMRSPPQHAGGDRVFVPELYLDCDMGVGDGTTPDPQWSLDWSDDDGNTWSNAVDASAGKVGEYGRRATWNRLGSFDKSRTFRLSNADPVKRIVLGAYARYAPNTMRFTEMEVGDV